MSMKDLETALTKIVGTEAVKAEKAFWKNQDVTIGHGGNQITLPDDPSPMSIQAGIDTLKRVQEEENTVYDVQEFIPGAWDDVLISFYRAMKKEFGIATTTGIKGFFGKNPPQMRNIRTGHGPGDVEQVPFGDFDIPGIEHQISVHPHRKDGQPGCYVVSKCRRAEKEILLRLVNSCIAIMREHSIYKGKAIRLRVDAEGKMDFSYSPEFMDTTKTEESDIIFPKDVERMIQTNLLAPIKHTETCRRNNIPLKRGILLEGPYGCGKSLTATVTAKVASDNGWTFINLDRSQGLKSAIEFARLYQPCVIFAEDIDRAADREEESVNDLVNLLDGVLSKNLEVMVVLTTNFVEKIDKALLRPGRFDAVISLETPDAEAAERLVRFYAGPLLNGDEDLSKTVEHLVGNIPATIREVVERAKLSMITEDRDTLSSSDLETSAYGMARHLDMLKDKDPEPTAGERLGSALCDVLADGFTNDGNEQTAKRLVQLMNNVRAARNEIDDVAMSQSKTQKALGAIKETQDEISDDIEEIKRAV